MMSAVILAVPLRDLSFFRTLSFAADTPPSAFSVRFEQIRGLLPPDARLGAFQAGTLAWFTGGGVTNLDGKVSSAAYRALADGRLHEYLRLSGVTHVIDWEWVFMRLCLRHAPSGSLHVERLAPGAHAYEGTLFRIQAPDEAEARNASRHTSLELKPSPSGRARLEQREAGGEQVTERPGE